MIWVFYEKKKTVRVRADLLGVQQSNWTEVKMLANLPNISANHSQTEKDKMHRF